MIIRLLLIFLIFPGWTTYFTETPNTSSTSEDRPWQLKKDKDGVKIYTRKNPKRAFDELKAVSVMNFSQQEMLSLIMDVSSHTKWVYNAIKSEPVKLISESEMIYYGETYAPWPVSNRDLIINIKAQYFPETGLLRVDAISLHDYLPNVNGKVRVPYSHSIWLISKMNQQIKVEYTLDIDPGGALPAWLVNLASIEGPYQSFLAMRKVLESGNYVRKEFSFLK
jgi:hypothetical protein